MKKYQVKLYIKNLIQTEGYIKLDDFLSIIGSVYYSDDNNIGKDFITAPEISQLFGEMLAINMVKNWYTYLYNQYFNIIELGPGNGKMIFDVLRTIKMFPEVYKFLKKIVLIETSDGLRNKQLELLKNFDSVEIDFCKCISEMDGFYANFILANEFFDALPIKQLFLRDDRTYEVVVSLNKQEELELSAIPSVDVRLNNSTFIETSPARERYFNEILKIMNKYHTHVTIIDYGYNESPQTSTLQALNKHKKVSIFHDLGNTDITSLVDFSQMKKIFKLFSPSVLYQKEFLIQSGILERSEILLRNGADAKKIKHEVNKLISDEEMGRLFKVFQCSNFRAVY